MMSNYIVAKMVDKHTKYKVTGLEQGLAGALRDADGVLVDFNSPFGYETVGKVIVPSSRYNSESMRLNAKKKFFSKNEQNLKVYGYVSNKYNYIMIYSLKKPTVTFKVAKGSKLIHTEERYLIDIRDYAKEFEQRG